MKGGFGVSLLVRGVKVAIMYLSSYRTQIYITKGSFGYALLGLVAEHSSRFMWVTDKLLSQHRTNRHTYIAVEAVLRVNATIGEMQVATVNIHVTHF